MLTELQKLFNDVVGREDIELFNQNYDDTSTVFTGGLNSNIYTFAGAMSPGIDGTTNRALVYKPVMPLYGYAPLGFDYDVTEETTSLGDNQKIVVGAGASYKIDFKYKVKYIDEDGTEDGYNIGVTLLPEDLNYVSSEKKTTFKPEENDPYHLKVVTENAVGFKPADSTDWIECSIVFTVPSNADISANNILALYVKGGWRKNIYIDDVKVTYLKETWRI